MCITYTSTIYGTDICEPGGTEWQHRIRVESFGDKSAVDQEIAWPRAGGKALPEPKMTYCIDTYRLDKCISAASISHALIRQI